MALLFLCYFGCAFQQSMFHLLEYGWIYCHISHDISHTVHVYKASYLPKIRTRCISLTEQSLCVTGGPI